ncbi:TetR/AcrR family transcriptional regulator [Gordonia sp. (in: high G+C Gram-positive bacteria)]|uniref:TetR/AcrR family transcriptional regulator n=1 Tax=Gordonia sp. (in: high G+C Gram-positive bacteria) TaxID=84139 RepID=UPI0016A72CC0|nr:TetR/AcrR family transcriptional regulator [Gordonia sp. (in: high G+C Gram-positive bacteria)]NLG46380.1 TetR/AcrR family transcriptional regulator [Gordonia sp. (in: high G+C Gram-positive bacteria)]
MPSSNTKNAVRISTSERIIVTAERLFSERGVDAVSLREVGAEAGQRNSGVVQYHFGDKEHLLTAILEFRMQRINEHRRRMLDAVELQGREPDLREYVEAFILPLATDNTPDSHYARFCAQLLADPRRRRGLGRDSASSLRETWAGIRASLDSLPADMIEDRLSMLINMSIRTIADHEGAFSDADTAWVINLIDAAIGLLTAPVSVARA